MQYEIFYWPRPENSWWKNNLSLNYNTINGLYITIVLEIIWEIFENTPYIINKYRQKKEFKNYKGDSIVNMIGDTIFTILGYYLSYKSEKIAILYMIISEIILRKIW